MIQGPAFGKICLYFSVSGGNLARRLVRYGLRRQPAGPIALEFRSNLPKRATIARSTQRVARSPGALIGRRPKVKNSKKVVRFQQKSRFSCAHGEHNGASNLPEIKSR